MLKRNFIVIWAAFFLAVFTALAHAQLPQTANGLGYLASAQNADGAWGNSAAVESTTATVTVLDTLKLMGQTAGTPYTSGIGWLQAQSPQPAAEAGGLLLGEVQGLHCQCQRCRGGAGE